MRGRSARYVDNPIRVNTGACASIITPNLWNVSQPLKLDGAHNRRSYATQQAESPMLEQGPRNSGSGGLIF